MRYSKMSDELTGPWRRMRLWKKNRKKKACAKPRRNPAGRLAAPAMMLTLVLALSACGAGVSSSESESEPSAPSSSVSSQSRPESSGPSSSLSSSKSRPASSSSSQSQSSSAPLPPATGREVGDMAADFSLPLVGGGEVTLYELRGKPVFLNFFATWCGPCMSEMPDIQKIHEDYGDTIEVLCIDVGEPMADVERFVQDKGFDFAVAVDTDGVLYEDFGYDFIPLSYFLDADGVITGVIPQMSDYDSFVAEIEKALG